MKKLVASSCIIFLCIVLCRQIYAQQVSRIPLLKLQQDFMDLRFGMFICIGSPTYQDEDWADPK